MLLQCEIVLPIVIVFWKAFSVVISPEHRSHSKRSKDDKGVKFNTFITTEITMEVTVSQAGDVKTPTDKGLFEAVKLCCEMPPICWKNKPN